MMHIGNGNRSEWEFEYTARNLADGAKDQKAFRLSRAQWWAEAKSKVMDEIKSTGLEVNESVAAIISNYANISMTAPQVSIRADMQKRLTECHSKIQSHTQAADEYEGWIQVLSANPENRLKLTQADWLYFFGKH